MAQTYFTGWVGERILTDLRKQLFRHLQRLSLGYFERNRAGAIISRITNDVEALDQLVTDGVTSLVQNTLMLIGSAVILFFLDWRLALAALVVFPVMSFATAIFRRRSSRAYRRVRERLGAVTATLQEDISGIRVLQAFRRESRNERQFREVNDHYREANQETVVLSGLYFPFVDFLSSLATAIVLGYGGYLVFDDSMSIGTLFAFIGYLANFFDPVQQLSQLYNTFLAAVAALDKIIDVLDEEPEILDREDARELAQIEGRVAFENVRFGYGDGPEVLHGIDLDVAAGTTVALVGHTGAGKSTIAKLLARFYDPREGRVTIDGTDLRDVTQASLRSQLGIVPQEGFLFAGTVRENIQFGRPDASPEEVAAAARAVGAARVHPRARERLRDRGRGTRNAGSRSASASSSPSPARCSPTRASSSSTRPRPAWTSERSAASRRRSRRSSTGRTAVIIAHRLSTIRGADLIVVLENGLVVEQGTHEELLAREGRYLALYGDWATEAA